MSEKDRIRLKNASRSKAKSSNWTLRFDWTLTESSDWTLRYDQSLPLIPLVLVNFNLAVSNLLVHPGSRNHKQNYLGELTLCWLVIRLSEGMRDQG